MGKKGLSVEGAEVGGVGGGKLQLASM